MTEYLHVSTTTPTRDDARNLLRGAVESRLAASGQIIGPVTGAWWHDGKYGEGDEWIILIKTSAERYPHLEEYFLRAHPWDNPEVTTYPIGGPARYLDWINKSTR